MRPGRKRRSCRCSAQAGANCLVERATHGIPGHRTRPLGAGNVGSGFGPLGMACSGHTFLVMSRKSDFVLCRIRHLSVLCKRPLSDLAGLAKQCNVRSVILRVEFESKETLETIWVKAVRANDGGTKKGEFSMEGWDVLGRLCGGGDPGHSSMMGCCGTSEVGLRDRRPSEAGRGTWQGGTASTVFRGTRKKLWREMALGVGSF